MPITHKFRSLARMLCLAAPFTLSIVPASAAYFSPVEILSASCGPREMPLPSDPPDCTTSVSEGHVAKSLEYFSNGFTLSLFVNGSAWTSGNQGGAFFLDAEVPLSFMVEGPSRSLVMVTDKNQTQTLDSAPGTIGGIFYAFSHFTVISRRPDGGDPVSLDFSYTSPTSMEALMSSDLASRKFGTSMQMLGEVQAGALFASMSASQTVRFYEADGVTPVNVFAQTPEPASFLLLLGGLPVCYLFSRKRRAAESVRS